MRGVCPGCRHGGRSSDEAVGVPGDGRDIGVGKEREMTRRWVARAVFLLAAGWVSSAAVPGVGQAEMEAGTVFRDCAGCPEMVVVPAGTYMMGSPEEADEMPIHRVTLGEPLAVGKYEVTFAEWDACVADGGCYGHRPDDEG